MNKTPVIHYYKDRKNLINSYYFALIPVLLFGFYKNGLLLYNTNLITFKSLIIPLYFYLISILIGFIVSKILNESPKINILVCLILASTISINTNVIIYPILLFASLFIIKTVKDKIKKPVNYLALTHLILLLSLLLNSYSYLNVGEKLNKFNYNLFDIFLGHTTGGLATTSMCILIFSFIILAVNKFYKKNIPIFASITYFIISIIYIFITKDFNHLSLILNGTIYFSFIFIAPSLYSTPTNPKATFYYGIIIGFLTSILVIFFGIYESSYIAILISSLIIPYLEAYTNKKYLHN